MQEELARLRQVCRRSLTCLYLEAIEEVADDVKEKVLAYTDALEQKIRELEKERDDAIKEVLVLTAEKMGMQTKWNIEREEKQVEIEWLKAILQRPTDGPSPPPMRQKEQV